MENNDYNKVTLSVFLIFLLVCLYIASWFGDNPIYRNIHNKLFWSDVFKYISGFCLLYVLVANLALFGVSCKELSDEEEGDQKSLYWLNIVSGSIVIIFCLFFLVGKYPDNETLSMLVFIYFWIQLVQFVFSVKLLSE